MNIAWLELITVLSAAAFALMSGFSYRPCSKAGDESETIWYLSAERTGRARKSLRQILLKRTKLQQELALSEERYIAGNRLSDDLYMDVSGPRVKLYINVQKEHVYISVLKGTVTVDNYACNADPEHRIAVQDSRVGIADTLLRFRKKEMGR